ncbi:MAG TPA: pyridoxamine 5'-phosphate oxidase family protein [Thermoanaerobaculia bacterium]|nr:pyridoxamine 5'-phosphate oxidase family protein [Thermoanaerobaculia bacterium]
MAHASERSDVEKLRDLIKGISFAMLTTVDEDGSLRSRPMQTQEAEFNGELWFFTSASSAKVDEVQSDQRVNVSYSDPDDNRYVSLSGTASLVRDREKIKELWKPVLKAWFPDGLEDPDLALLRVKVEKAEYWDSPSSKMVQLFGFLKALATGERLDYAGENEKVDMNPMGTSTR